MSSPILSLQDFIKAQLKSGAVETPPPTPAQMNVTCKHCDKTLLLSKETYTSDFQEHLQVEHGVQYAYLSLQKVKDPRSYSVQATYPLSEKNKGKDTTIYHIPVTFMAETAAEFQQKEALFKDLVFFVPFIIMFIFFVMVGFDTRNMFYFGKSVAGIPSTQPVPPLDLVFTGPTWGQTFMDLHEPADWYWWVRTTLLDTHFDKDNSNLRYPSGFPLPSNNIPVGAIRVRTIRVTSDSCKPVTSVPVYEKTCYGSVGQGINESQHGPFPYYSCPRPYLCTTEGISYFYDCSGNYLDVPFSSSYNEAKNLVTTLLPTSNFVGFIEPGAARLVVVSTVTYNPSMKLFGLTEFMVELTVGGQLVVESRFQPFEVWSKDYTGSSIYFIFFFLVTLFFCFRVLRALFTAEKFFGYLLQLWTIVELINLGIFVIMFITRFTWWGQSVASEFKLSPNATSFPAELTYIAGLYKFQLRLNIINTVLIFLQVLKYTSLSPGLEVVTASMLRASKNIGGLLCIFVIVLLAYSIAGNALFGGQMFDFRDIGFSFSSAMRMLLGDSDYESMAKISPYMAGLYYWSFLVIGLFLLLNFIIALIGEAFDFDGANQAQSSVYDELSMMMRNIVRSVRRFLLGPKQFIIVTLRVWSEDWAKEGKYGLIFSILSLEKEKAPLVGNRGSGFVDGFTDLMGIINRSDKALEKTEYLTEAFIEDFWQDAKKKFLLQEQAPEQSRIREQAQAIKEQAQIAIRDQLLRNSTTVNKVTVNHPMPVLAMLEPVKDVLKEICNLSASVSETMETMNDLLVPLEQ